MIRHEFSRRDPGELSTDPDPTIILLLDSFHSAPVYVSQDDLEDQQSCACAACAVLATSRCTSVSQTDDLQWECDYYDEPDSK